MWNVLGINERFLTSINLKYVLGSKYFTCVIFFTLSVCSPCEQVLTF